MPFPFLFSPTIFSTYNFLLIDANVNNSSGLVDISAPTAWPIKFEDPAWGRRHRLIRRRLAVNDQKTAAGGQHLPTD
jgi:hypothetical protein